MRWSCVAVLMLVAIILGAARRDERQVRGWQERNDVRAVWETASRALDCSGLPSEAIQALRALTTEKALLDNSAQMFQASESSMFGGMLLEPAERYLLFCCALSHRLAPYGSAPAAPALLDQIRKPRLNCCGYVSAAVGLFEALEPEAARHLSLVGFHGGAVGNHVQILLRGPKRTLLADPSAGLAAFTTFDELLQGKPVAEPDVLLFFSEKVNGELRGHSRQVREALVQGKYRPSDLLYVYRSRRDWLAAASRWDKYSDFLRHLPTPAGQSCYASWLRGHPDTDEDGFEAPSLPLDN